MQTTHTIAAMMASVAPSVAQLTTNANPAAPKK
jgi:hypothetical protein